MNIQIIVGSIREGRVAIKVAEWVQNYTQKLNTPNLSVEILDLKAWDLPLFSGVNPPATGIYDQPKQQQWADKIAKGDAFVIISPEYNHGYSPALKNALDFLHKEWKNKNVAYISYGSTFGSRAIDQIRLVGLAIGLNDVNAILQIRDIFNRNKDTQFIANTHEEKALETILTRLSQTAF